MICIRFVKEYCNGDITKIENYDKAIADTTQTWICHHRLGILPFSKKTISHEKLDEYGLYYNQPPEALLFITKSEHSSLHRTGKKGEKRSEETKIKTSEAMKNNTNGKGNKGKPSPQKGKNWYNNGIKSIRAFECPEGFVPGRLRKCK